MAFFLIDEGDTGREAKYSDFQIKNSTEDYALAVSGFEADNIYDMKDDFSAVNGAIFVTKSYENTAGYTFLQSTKTPGW